MARWTDSLDENTDQVEVLGAFTEAPEMGKAADDWPYPDEVIDTRAVGELRERILVALGYDADEDREVLLRERIVSGGYSEYTQENHYYVTISVDGSETQVPQGRWYGGFAQLMAWLDEKAPVR